MYKLKQSPVVDVSFGDALSLSLNNYYDLLKTQVGGLGAEEYLQLKLVADVLDVSDKGAAEGGYKWFSNYNLLKRSDKSIDNNPVTGDIQTNVETLVEVYGNFLRKLRRFAVRKILSPEEQIKIDEYDLLIQSLQKKQRRLHRDDVTNWRNEAEVLGYEVGDTTAYVQWSSRYGNIRKIEELEVKKRGYAFDKKTILLREYPDPADEEIVNAEVEFDNPFMRLRYPISPDTDYPNGDSFSLPYLAALPHGSTALFDDRHAMGWSPALTTMLTSNAGSFTANFDKTTSSSSSISTDWGASGSARYGFIKVKASVSEQKTIKEDFSKAKSMKLSANSAFKINILFPSWFKESIFRNARLKENIDEFSEFFGENGSLLYFPVGLIAVRGFKAEFLTDQNWTYDYKSKFSASGGGGFKAFGINFGASSKYKRNVKEHKVDQSTTKLTLQDDENTLRFVGYVVKKNVFSDAENKILTANDLDLTIGN